MEKLSLGFYVYVHRRRTDQTVFYVGKGNNDRAWSFDGRNREWLREAVDNGRTVEFVRIGLTEDQALDLERVTIRQMRDAGIPLVNVYAGGNGCCTSLKARAPDYVDPTGVQRWTWKRSPRHSTWELKSISQMMRKYGGDQQDWQNVINGVSKVGPAGWRLSISRS